MQEAIKAAENLLLSVGLSQIGLAILIYLILCFLIGLWIIGWAMKKTKEFKQVMVKCPVCSKKVETVILRGVQKYFDIDGAYHECRRK